jgi:sugar phosphate isomerase/epimerase
VIATEGDDVTTVGPNLGVTLFSFTDAYHARRYTFEELIRKAGSMGLGPGLEIVGFQSIRGYPTITDSFALRFKHLLDESGLEPSALGANIDAGRRRDRLMTHEETVETLRVQIDAAAKLGFHVLRVQFGASADALEAVLAMAERSDVKLGMEVHSPHTVDHPTMLALRERYAKLGSPYLGFVPDFGATMTAIPAGLVQTWRADPESPDELLEITIAAWERAHRGEN